MSKRTVGVGVALIVAFVVGILIGFSVGPIVKPPETTTVTLRPLELARANLLALGNEFLEKTHMPLAGLDPLLESMRMIQAHKLDDDKGFLFSQTRLLDPPFTAPPSIELLKIYSLDEFFDKFRPSPEFPDVYDRFARNIVDELDREVKPGDIFAEIAWLSRQGRLFPSFAVIDGESLEPKYDTFMLFVPVRIERTPKTSPNTSSLGLHESKEEAVSFLRGSLVTIFGRPVVEAESKITANLGLVPGTAPGVYSFTLLLDFRTFLSGLMAPIFSLWVPAGVAVGAPVEAITIGDDAIAKAPLYSALWLEAVNGTFETKFEVEVFDRLEPGEVKYTADAKVGMWGGSVSWDPPDFYEVTAINILPSDDDRIELVDSIRPERGYFVGIGSTLKVQGRASLDAPAVIRFQALFLLISGWNWTVIDVGQINVYDEL